MRHEKRHVVAGEERMVADRRQLALKVRWQRHGARRLQIPKRGDEMRGAFRSVGLMLEHSLRRFSEPGRLAVLRLFESLFVPGR